MKELTLHDLQTFGLKIMKEIDHWCLEHEVNYSLCGGSLIGAIRHGGFIPWDDDIDIVMPRPEYEKFVKGFLHPDLVCIAPELGNSYLTFARVADTKETKNVAYCPWCTLPDVGLYVDIFPIDGECEDYGEFQQTMNWLKRKDATIYQIKGAKLPISSDLGGVRILKNIGKKILYGHYSLRKELESYMKVEKAIAFGATSYCGNLACPTAGVRERQRTKVFQNYIRIQFEDCELSAVRDYDEYMRDIFGDYMKLPPEKDRVPKHSEHKFYFK